MSRDIRFRAWDGKGMSSPMTLMGIGNGKHNISFNTDGQAHEEYTQLMQYTGLKDKNGKEIYEGDIVNYGIGFKGSSQRQQPGEVVWESAGAYFRIKDSSSDTGNSWSSYLDELWCEVIGNIYENPELLQ